MITSPSVDNIVTLPTPLPSKRYHTGLLKSCPLSNLPPRNLISALSNPSTSKPDCQSLRSKIHASNSSFEGANGSMVKVRRRYDTPSLPTSSSACSTKSGTMKKESMSKRPSVWVLPPSYDLENLRGMLGPQTPTVSFSPVSTSPSTLLP